MRFIVKLHRRRAQPERAGCANVQLSLSAYSAKADTAIAKRIRAIQSVRAFSRGKMGTTLRGKMLDARIWRSYRAKAGRCHPSVGFFGDFWPVPGWICLAAHRSGLLARVRASASARRQAATRAWSPELRISGIGRPSNRWGRVNWGYSSSPSEKLSSAPDAGVDQRHGCDLTARQHVVADRDFLELAGIDHPLIDALEPPADDQGAGPGGQFRNTGLGQWPTPRAHQELWPVRRDFRRIDGARP